MYAGGGLLLYLFPVLFYDLAAEEEQFLMLNYFYGVTTRSRVAKAWSI